MSLTYTWKINSIKIKDEVNVDGETLPKAVCQTYWKCTGTDVDGNTGEFSGATPFSAANVPAGSFVSFESLTEETVIGWIRNIVENDAGYKAHIDGVIQKQIDAVIEEEVEESSLPWAPADVTPTVPADAPAEDDVEDAEIVEEDGAE